jgi:DNA-binding NtrC family response regulator
MAPLRVLIVEDSEDDTLLLVRELRRGGFEPEFIRVETPEDLGAALKDREWDLVISDYLMPHFSGLDAFRMVRESGLDLPFIIVSGKIGEDTAVEAMRVGVHDYIMKDNLLRLAPAVQREIEDARNRAEHRKAREELLKYRERLEELVKERTAELTRTIELLQIEASERERIEQALREWIRQYRELGEKVNSSDRV